MGFVFDVRAVEVDLRNTGVPELACELLRLMGKMAAPGGVPVRPVPVRWPLDHHRAPELLERGLVVAGREESAFIEVGDHLLMAVA